MEADDRSAPAVALSDSLDGKTATINRIDGLMSEVGIVLPLRAVMAIAAKNARMAWAVLMKSKSFKLPA